MNIVDISQFGDALVLHFSTDDKRINAYTLASTLVALADAAKAANATLNTGCEIEVVVEALAPGSFRALIRTIYTNSRNLLANQIVFSLVLGVLGNYIYERTLSASNDVSVEIKTDEVIIEKGNERLVVPRNVYDATRRAEKNPQFVKSMNRTFEAVASDEKVKSFGLVAKMDSPAPAILIPHSTLATLASQTTEGPDTRTINEQAELQIVKAILEKTKRRWGFVWRGVTISAPVLHDQFYADFFAHAITIAPGDTLKVTLAIKQVRDSETGIYKNTGYEVVEVHDHIPRIRQVSLMDTDEKN